MTRTPLQTRWSVAALLCLLSALATMALLLGGCGRSDADRAKDITDRFLTAMDNRDWDTARTMLTEKAKDRMGEHDPFSASDTDTSPSPSPSPDTNKHKIGDPRIDGDTAVVPASVTNGNSRTDASVKLRRENGEWRVYAVRLEGGPDGMGITMDFEHPEEIFGDAFRAIGAGMGAMMKGVGEGLGAMMKGVGEGVAAMNKSMAASPSPDATATPGVQIEEKSEKTDANR